MPRLQCYDGPVRISGPVWRPRRLLPGMSSSRQKCNFDDVSRPLLKDKGVRSHTHLQSFTLDQKIAGPRSGDGITEVDIATLPRNRLLLPWANTRPFHQWNCRALCRSVGTGTKCKPRFGNVAPGRYGSYTTHESYQGLLHHDHCGAR